ncbi:MAG: sodium/solute symporter [Phycisphaerae bacterium]|nr:sodium/solute symporter [Phycisphaerae bacterium]
MPSGGLTTIDYMVCIAYLLFITALGAIFYGSQKSTKDYFLAGKSMGWIPVGLSLMATLTSAIGFIGSPAGAWKYGLILLWGLTALPLSFPIVVWVFMPFYHKLNVYTAYEYLERRFDVRVRALTSGIFILWRITWMAAAVYVPSFVLNVVTGEKLPLVPTVIALGILATLYTSMGGIKAVIWTDVAQFVIMFGGMITAAIIIITGVEGGLPEIWRLLSESGKSSFVAKMPGWDAAGFLAKIKLYVYSDVTVVAIVLTATLGKLGNYCVDQVMVQRYLTARSLRTSQGAFLCNCFAYAFYICSMTLVGVGLFAFMAHHAFPEGLRNDEVFPYFIAYKMPAGVAGLMIAAIYAASMSSLDSGVNSCITAITNDFYNRLWKGRRSLDDDADDESAKTHHLRIAQVSSLVLGLLVTVLACFVGRMGDVFMIAAKLIQGFIGPLFGIFILAMFTRRASAFGAMMGGAIGTVLTGIAIFAEKLGGAFLVFDIGFMWPTMLGFLSTLVLGYGFSLVSPPPVEDKQAWTWRGVMNQPEA